MDRSFEELRDEVLALDNEKLRELADEVEARLGAFEPSEADYKEAAERLEKFDRGEITAMTAEEAMASVRARLKETQKRSS
jgi:hypothetical protein